MDSAMALAAWLCPVPILAVNIKNLRDFSQASKFPSSDFIFAHYSIPGSSDGKGEMKSGIEASEKPPIAEAPLFLSF